MKRTAFAISIASTFLTVGCSTITQSETQGLALTASYESKPVEANCQLKNDRGSWDAKAPSNVTVRKSGEDLEVTCKKEGMPDGILKAVSSRTADRSGNSVSASLAGPVAAVPRMMRIGLLPNAVEVGATASETSNAA